MNKILSTILTSLLAGLLGYVFSLGIIVFNKLLIINNVIEMYSSKKSDVISKIIFVISHDLSSNDLILGFVGFLLLASLKIFKDFDSKSRFFNEIGR